MPGCGSCSRNSLTTSSLGFKDTKCCAVACPNFPLHHVRICFRVNNNTQVKIQQGCLVTTHEVAPLGARTECVVDYRSGVTEDSWGRKCRVIYWDRFVPTDSFIRLRICASDSCDGGCSNDDINASGQVIPNALINFEIDGVKIINTLQAILVDHVNFPGGISGCVQVNCTNSADRVTDCCQIAGGITWDSLSNIPWNSQIVVGPIGISF